MPNKYFEGDGTRAARKLLVSTARTSSRRACLSSTTVADQRDLLAGPLQARTRPKYRRHERRKNRNRPTGRIRCAPLCWEFRLRTRRFLGYTVLRAGATKAPGEKGMVPA